ncbi:MAG: TetR/AcrR family transcriptional regulator [Lachnospiraceae bacterium]|nr:TetR/AcrR family transcriptional regulator [Lachnospiraceae bacterium]
MNQKFYDMKNEKQDRILNAGFKSFALYGYKNASTDEIIKDAGISKGLLFHYFESKVGFYEFSYDYAVRFLELAFDHFADPSAHSFNDIARQNLQAYFTVARSYPFALLLLEQARFENYTEAMLATEKSRQLYENLIEKRKALIDPHSVVEGTDLNMLLNIIDYVIFGELRRSLSEGSFLPDIWLAQITREIELLCKTYGIE